MAFLNKQANLFKAARTHGRSSHTAGGRPSRSVLYGFLTLTALLGGHAGADQTAAPTPLYATPDLKGQPVLTLPAGKPVSVLSSSGESSSPHNREVVIVPYGERLLYGRPGTVKSSSTGVRLSGEQWGLPPQPPGPVKVILTREPDTPAHRVRDWVVRVIPLAPATVRGVSLRVQAPPVQSVAVRAREERQPVALGRLAPGHYLVTASRADAPSAVLHAEVLEVTALALSAFSTPTELLVWATRLSDGAVVPGVRLEAEAFLRDEQGERGVSRRLAPVVTNAQGLARLPRRDRESIRLLGSVAIGAVTHRTVLNPYGGGVGTAHPTRARALIQSEKPVYRPGETLRGSALVRGLTPGRRAAYTGPVTVRLVGVGYPAPTLARLQLRSDPDGLVRFAFPLPRDVRIGEYDLEVEVPTPATPANPSPSPSVSRLPVRVQAFVKPQFTLDLEAPAEIVTGEALPLGVRAELYAGGGAAVQADVFLSQEGGQETLFAPAAPDRLHDLYGHQSEAWTHSDYGLAVSPDQKPTARLTVSGGRGQVNLRPKAPGNVPHGYQVTLRARDEYGRDVLETRSFTVYPAGLKFALPDMAGDEEPQQGDEVRTQVLVQQVKTGAAQPGRPVEVAVVWHYSVPVRAGGRTEYRRREEVISRRQIRTDAAGRLNVTFRAAGPGEYQVRLLTRDAQGRTVRGSYGAAYVAEPTSPTSAHVLGLAADRPRYQVGDTARLTLETDLPRGTPLLVSAQVEGRVTPRVVRVTGPRMSLSWKVGSDLAPGVVFSAVGVYQADTVQTSTPLLFVPRTDRRLDVTVGRPVGTLKPGAESTLTVRTRQDGQPVSALVTLAVVHEAVYAVAEDPTPDPWRLLWGAEHPSAWFFYTAGVPFEGGGGGGGAGSGGAVFRQDGREVAAFETVRTGPDGTAQVRVHLPELLGPYRVSARALTRESAAGEARTTLRTELPFAVRLSRPRVLTHGDEGSAYLSVQGRSGTGPAAVLLGFKAAGKETTRSLPLNAGALTTHFPLPASKSGLQMTLEAWAKQGTLQDALRESLPLREAGPRTLLTGQGARSEAGRLIDALAWPQEAAPESLVVDLAATPLQAALGSLESYLADPAERWSTTEGAAARLSANLDLAGLAGRLGWTTQRDQALVQARRDLTDLIALRGEGGWGWTASSKPTADMTALALSAIIRAKGAGLTDAETLHGALADARRLRRTPHGSPSALLASALAVAGEPAAAVHLARAGQVAPADAARLAAVLAGPAPDLARKLYGRARAQARESASGTLVLGGSHDTEATAWLLQAAVKLGRRPDAARLSATLLAQKTGGAWNSPVATATALTGLRALVEAEARRPATRVTLSLGDYRQTVRLGPPVRITVPTPNLSQGGALRLEADGPVAFRRELRVRAQGRAPAAPSPVVVERRYDRTRVGRDEVVTVTLTVRATTKQQHLRLTDPVPGGLEAVDDRPFAFPGWVQPAGAARTVWAERSLYDDRAVFYLETIAPGVTTVRYQLRALAPGRYTAPAPRVDFARGTTPAVGSAQKFEVTP